MSKNLKLVKRIAAVATAVCVVAGMMVSASAYGITEPVGGFVYDGSESSVTVPVTGTSASGQVTIVVRKDNDNWLTDPNNNVVFIDQVTGAEGSTSITFGIDNKWLTDDKKGEYKIFVGGSSQAVTTAKLTIDAEPKPAPTLSSIAIDAGAKTEYTVGDAFVAPTVTATYSDGSTQAVTATFSGYDMAAAGAQTVTATYEGKTATYTINVTAKEQPPVEPGNGEGEVINVYRNSFGKEGKSYVDVKLAAADNGNKKVTVGGVELFYSVQRECYVGLVDASAVVDGKIAVETSDEAPTILVYGNVNGNYNYTDISKAVDGTDVLFLKRANAGTVALSDRQLFAADVNGDGKADGTDVLFMKRYTAGTLATFPVLGK